MSASLFLGRDTTGPDLRLDPARLRTHGIVVGMTGSGKTGLSLVLLEELVRAGVPVIAIDPKGDLGNLGLLFPRLAPEEFAPWVAEGDPAQVAARWREGLAAWKMGPAEVAALQDRMDLSLFTPGSEAGLPLNVLGSFSRPSQAILEDDEARRELISDLVSGLLGLAGRTDVTSRDAPHVVLSQVLDAAWANGEDPDLASLVLRLVDPPFQKVGVFPLDRFFPPDDRMKLAMDLNGVVASPAFVPWTRGAALDVDALLAPGPRTRVSIFNLAHLDEAERQFVVSLLLGRVLAWSRSQPGTEKLRAVLYFDEVAGYLPPHPKSPPSKGPLLTLMKQARAMGLGVVLATQNPVDLDYKALSNAGLWCIGRLSTEQDRRRLLEGMGEASLDQAVARLGKQEFLLYQSTGAPVQVLRSRHALCYLRGPFTRQEVIKLKAASAGRAAPGTPFSPPPPVPVPGRAAFVPPPSAPAFPGPLSPPPPVAAAAPTGLLPAAPRAGVPNLYLDPRVVFSARLSPVFAPFAEPRRPDGRLVFQPALLVELMLRFDEENVGFILDERLAGVWFPLGASLPEQPLPLRLEPGDFGEYPPADALFAPLPTWMDEEKELKVLSTRIIDDTFRSETRGMFANKALQLYGRANEPRESFDARCRAAVQVRVEEAVAKLQGKVQANLDRIDQKIAAQEAKLDELEGTVKHRQMEEALNVGETVFGFFVGRRKSLSSAMSRRRQTSTAVSRKSAAEEELDRLRGEAERVAEDLGREVETIRQQQAALLQQTEEREVRLEKADIRLDRLAVLWVPVTRRV